MKKLLLSIACMLFTSIAMAQTLDFTFTKVSASEATVAVTGNGVEAGGITATIASNYDWKSLSANSSTYPNASIVCPDKNTNAMTAGNEGIITLTLNNVPENYSFKNVTFTSVALNGGGAFQGDDVNAQHVNFTLTKGETTLGTVDNVAIKVNSSPNNYNGTKDQSVTVPFEVAEAYTAENGTLELKLKLSVTESKGCFYGLIKVAIETEVATAPAEPVTFTAYTLNESMQVSGELAGTVEKVEMVAFACSDATATLVGTEGAVAYIFDKANETPVAESTLFMVGDLNVGQDVAAMSFSTFTTPGTYVVYIPASSFTINGVANENIMSAEFTIPEPVVPETKVFEIESVTPSNGAEVDAINEIVVKFTEDITLAMDNRGNFYPVNLVDENDNVIELAVSDDTNIYSKVVLTPAEPITAAGTYTLDLSQIKLNGGVCEGSYSWTIEEVVVAPEVTELIDATKEYYLKSSWNYGMNSGYFTLGTKSGSNYGHAYMANDKSQAFKFTLVENGDNKYYTLATEIENVTGGSYPAYVDCSHASNVNSNAMTASNIILELENATSSKYVIKTANGYLTAAMIDHGTDGYAYHVFSNGDRDNALVFSLVEKVTEAPVVAAPAIVEITPANGAEVASLSEIVITFDKAIKEIDTLNGIIKVKTSGSTSRAYGYSATISADGLTVTFPIGDDMGGFKTIDAAGEYTIEIPAGVVTSTDGAKNEAANYAFTIAAPAPEVTELIDATKEYYLKASWNYSMNSGYFTLGTKSGSNYGHAYMANDKSQSFKFTLVENGDNKYYTLATEIENVTGGSYPVYVDCSHASNVNSNAMTASNIILELENATSSKYVIKTANGYLTAAKIDYGTDGYAYHVFSNGDRDNALAFSLVEKVTEAPVVAAPAIVEITPANGAEVPSLSEIVITFDKAIKEIDTLNGIIKVKTSGSTSRAYGYSATISADGLTVTFPIGDDMGGTKTIDAAGEYTIEIPAGVVTSTDGAKNEAANYTFTIGVTEGIDAVDAEAENDVIYDLTGRRIAEIVKPGIYIVNGKKILVK